MNLELQGRTVFVAGSSRGIGLAIARGFLAEGARVVISGRDAISLEIAGKDLASVYGSANVLAVQADLVNDAGLAAALDTARKFGQLDVVVANLGSGTAPQGHAIARADWIASLDLNLLASMRLAALTLDELKARGGSLIFVSSIAGLEDIGAPVPYSASKAALIAAAKTFARQAGPTARVNVVAPGNILFPGGSWERKLADRKAHFETYVRDNTALQRFGTPQEIADAVLFLASPRAAFITGSVLVADGGQTRGF